MVHAWGVSDVAARCWLAGRLDAFDRGRDGPRGLGGFPACPSLRAADPKRCTVEKQTFDAWLGKPEDEVDWVKFEADVERRLKAQAGAYPGLPTWQRHMAAVITDQMIRDHWSHPAKRRADELLAPEGAGRLLEP